jgi:hypothetical protein
MPSLSPPSGLLSRNTAGAIHRWATAQRASGTNSTVGGSSTTGTAAQWGAAAQQGQQPQRQRQQPRQQPYNRVREKHNRSLSIRPIVSAQQ